MPTTLNKLSEQAWRIIKGGTPSDDTELTLREVREAITQAINRRLKTEHLSVHQQFGEHFPPHHLIATYDNVAVASVSTPTLTIECTEATDLVITSVEMTIDHLGDDPDYYQITVTGITYSGMTEAEVEALVTGASDSCALTFTTEDTGPVSFLIAGIEEFDLNGSTLTFFYYPDAVPETGYWTTADGLYWATADGTYWTTPTSGTGTAIPTVLSDYVEDSHFILSTVLVGTDFTFSFDITGVSICCLVSDEAEIDAYVTLPAQPISLPRGMGVWRVFRPTAPNAPFIPLSSQVMAIATNITHTNMSSILGALTAYEYMNNTTLRFNQPASTIGSTVTIQLLVNDYTASPDSILPIPADMEATVIEDTIKLFSVQQPLDKSNDENDQR